MQDSYNEDREKYYKRSKRISIATIIILLICLILAYFIWAMSDASIAGNTFQFGNIDIEVGYYDDLSNPIEYGTSGADTKMFDVNVVTVGEDTVMTGDSLVTGEVDHPDSSKPYLVRQKALSRKFYVKNNGDVSAYYRVYFENIDADVSELGADKIGMSSQILVTIREEGSSTTGSGIRGRKASLMDRESINNMLDPKHGIIGLLGPGETKNLIIELVLPEDGNDYTINNNSCFTFDLCVEAVQEKNNTLDNNGGNFN